MKQFSRLFTELDATTSTLAKVAALQRYFALASSRDAAWAVYFLSGGKPRQVVKTATLRALACASAGIEDWLFEACYQAVGDLAETIAYVLPAEFEPSDVGLAEWVEARLLPLRGLSDADIAQRISSFWRELDPQGRFLLIKLVGGGFRVGVSKLLVQRALAAHSGLDVKRIAQRMMGYVDAKALPSATKFEALIADSTGAAADILDAGQPYPFFLAHALDAPLETLGERLGPVQDWLVEWKYDGIRGQLVKRASQVWIWSRGEELLTEHFPEIVALAQSLPDGTVLDGEILVWREDAPASFAALQQRLGRKTLSRKILVDAPVTFIAYDLLEMHGQDLRDQPQQLRRSKLEQLLAGSGMKISALEQRTSWAEFAALRTQARERGVEGFMLKHVASAYGSGRQKRKMSEGDLTTPVFSWWKSKLEPMTVDCVLIYAQAGHGRRASLYTDYTFAVWSRTPQDSAEAQSVVDAIERREPPQAGALQLLAFAKAYTGLSDAEFKQVDGLVRKSTLEKFGPVRSVKPTLVFELAFEGINPSARHKSGLAVRFPRMLRIRTDKPLHEANTLEDLQLLLR
jgi:DNA ligase-1